MKILAIIGSTRKANTYNIVKRIEQYHKEITDCEYEYIFLKDINIDRCLGCFACISKGEDYCPLKDDRNLVVQKMEASDGVILASPNYAMNVSWLMKNCIDRFAYTCHRPKYFNQKFMLLITSGGYMGVKNAMKALSIMASGGNVVSKLSVFYSPQMSEKKLRIRENKIKKNTEKFVKSIKEKNGHRPSLSFLIWFSVFKALSEKNQENFPADYNYYKNKNYFIDCHLNSFQMTIIKFFKSFFRILIVRGII